MTKRNVLKTPRLNLKIQIIGPTINQIVCFDNSNNNYYQCKRFFCGKLIKAILRHLVSFLLLNDVQIQFNGYRLSDHFSKLWCLVWSYSNFNTPRCVISGEYEVGDEVLLISEMTCCYMHRPTIPLIGSIS